MSEAIVFLAAPFAMCLVIASIHTYLGMHVLEREVIFVDLSLAQVAALGATVAGVLGAHEHGLEVDLAATGFTIVGAALFAVTCRARRFVSQEAIVGITYAVSSAVTILVLSRAPQGAEHLKDTLVGSLLLTGWDRVLEAAGLYVVLGALQLLFAKRFIELSWRPDTVQASLTQQAWWDFLFYTLFGLVITISVQVAGILLVFSYLIVPAVVTKFFAEGLLRRMLLGWAVAIVASVAGLSASWAWDLPTGAAIVAAFAVVLVCAGAGRAAMAFRT